MRTWSKCTPHYWFYFILLPFYFHSTSNVYWNRSRMEVESAVEWEWNGSRISSRVGVDAGVESAVEFYCWSYYRFYSHSTADSSPIPMLRWTRNPTALSATGFSSIIFVVGGLVSWSHLQIRVPCMCPMCSILLILLPFYSHSTADSNSVLLQILLPFYCWF